MFMYEEIDFDQNGFMTHAKNVGAQLDDGAATVVWPSSVAAAPAVWPVPSWSKRG